MRNIDFISTSPYLSIFERGANQTIFGGILFLIYGIIFIILAIIYLYDYISKANYTFDYTLVKEYLNQSDFTWTTAYKHIDIFTSDLEVKLSLKKDKDLDRKGKNLTDNFFIIDVNKMQNNNISRDSNNRKIISENTSCVIKQGESHTIKMNFDSFGTRSQKLVLNQLIRNEGGPEIDPETDLRTQDVLRIGAHEVSDVPGGFAKDGIHRELDELKSVHHIHEPLHRARPMLRVARMAGPPGDGHLEGLGALAGRGEEVVRGFADQDEFPSGVVFRVGLGAERPGLFPGEKKQAEILVAFLAEPLASAEHTEYLPFGVAGAATLDDRVVFLRPLSVREDVAFLDQLDARGDIRRDSVQMGAEDEFRAPCSRPVQQQVDRPVPHLELLNLRFHSLPVRPLSAILSRSKGLSKCRHVILSTREGSPQPLLQESRQPPLLPRSGINPKYFQKKVQIHYSR